MDVVEKRRIEKQRSQVALHEAETFTQAARDFLANHTVRKTGQEPRRWRETARLLVLHYPLDGEEPTVIKGGLCARSKVRELISIAGYERLRERDHLARAVVGAVRGHREPGQPDISGCKAISNERPVQESRLPTSSIKCSSAKKMFMHSRSDLPCRRRAQPSDCP